MKIGGYLFVRRFQRRMGGFHGLRLVSRRRQLVEEGGSRLCGPALPHLVLPAMALPAPRGGTLLAIAAHAAAIAMAAVVEAEVARPHLERAQQHSDLRPGGREVLGLLEELGALRLQRGVGRGQLRLDLREFVREDLRVSPTSNLLFKGSAVLARLPR